MSRWAVVAVAAAAVCGACSHSRPDAAPLIQPTTTTTVAVDLDAVEPCHIGASKFTISHPATLDTTITRPNGAPVTLAAVVAAKEPRDLLTRHPRAYQGTWAGAPAYAVTFDGGGNVKSEHTRGRLLFIIDAATAQVDDENTFAMDLALPCRAAG